jgi:dUTP pyrophosphatase
MNTARVVQIMRLPHAANLAGDLPLPAYDDSRYAGGLDLLAAIPAMPPMPAGWATIKPGHWAAIPTGLIVTLPPGLMGLIRPITGFVVRYGVTVLGAPQMLDSGYRGELQVVLMNFGSEPFEVKHGMRIANLVLFPTVRASIVEVASVEANA